MKFTWRRSINYLTLGNVINSAYRWGLYKAYGPEGLNKIFATFPPAWILSTLYQHGAVIGDHTIIYSPLIIHNYADGYGCHYRNLKIGSYCNVGRDVFLDLTNPITMEDCVTVSMRVTILTHVHAGFTPLTESGLPPQCAPVKINYGAYIGAGATLLHGITIGKKSIVGAGAVVTRSVPDGVVVVGVPARVIRKVD